MADTELSRMSSIVTRLRQIARDQGRDVADVPADAIRHYEDARFWEEARAGYERINADPEDRAVFDAEIAQWDSALLDGLDVLPFDDD